MIERTEFDETVKVGQTVRLRDLDKQQNFRYPIVHTASDRAAGFQITADSPVGRALLGRARGDVIEVEIPRGKLRLEILAVEP